MFTYRQFWIGLVGITFFFLAGRPAASAPPAERANGPATRSAPASPGKAGATAKADRQQLLQWLDQYLTQEVLFRKQDIEALQAKIDKMSPAQLQAWLDETQEIRTKLSSDEWKSTRVWLEGYLAKKLYSDQETEQFQADVAKLSPSELLQLLKRIEQKHDTIQSIYDAQYASAVRGQQAQETARLQAQSRLQWQKNYLKEQDAAKRAAVQRSQMRSNRPFYGQTQAQATGRRRTSRRYDQPLITSRRAARMAVDRAIYGGGGWRW